MSDDQNSQQGLRKERVGVVVSAPLQKTITVRVDRLVPHERYGKVITRSHKFHAHDELNQARKGDKVRIVETRPLSKLKRWRLVEVVAKAEL
jgi:small subunit ribosomal protein S17